MIRTHRSFRMQSQCVISARFVLKQWNHPPISRSLLSYYSVGTHGRKVSLNHCDRFESAWTCSSSCTRIKIKHQMNSDRYMHRARPWSFFHLWLITIDDFLDIDPTNKPFMDEDDVQISRKRLYKRLAIGDIAQRTKNGNKRWWWLLWASIKASAAAS